MTRAPKEWIVKIHWDADHCSPAIGPYGMTEAENEMREARRAYRDLGLTPPRMTKELLKDPQMLGIWARSKAERQAWDRAHGRADD